MDWIVIDFCIFILNVAITGVIIPKILLVAFRKKLFDVPDERKIHQGAVPRLGGIAFGPVIIFSLTLLIGVAAWNAKIGFLTRFYPYITEMSLLMSSGVIMYLVGMCDDLIGVKYSAKFIAQIMCGIMLCLSGLWITQFDGFLWVESIPVWLGVPLTILIVVFIINAINLIDGIDGLASGLCGVALLYYSVVFYLMKNYVYSVVAIAALGTLVPFFYFNVFGDASKGNKIFMGDTGALTIGIIICFMSVKLCSATVVNSIGDCNPLVVAFAPLMIPCLDVIRVFGNRIMRGNNPFLPDKTHIHHKLLAIGMTQQMALISILIISVICTVGTLLLSKVMNVTFVLLISIGFYMFWNWRLNMKGRYYRHKNALSVDLKD